MQVRANGVSLEVEDHGPSTGEPLVLVMGLGMQLVAWPDPLVARLVERGFRVIRFDNRDIGLSQAIEAPVPNLALAAIRHSLGLRIRSPYTLADMATDTVGVLDALGIARAHVCGASMGGMIAQHLGFSHAGRLQSLTLMMTTTGARRLPGPSWKVRQALLSQPKRARGLEGLVEHYVTLYGLIGSPAHRPDPAWLRQRITRFLQRSYRPAGTARQMLAIAADGDRSARTSTIELPTQVIHGAADPLIPVASGHDLAARIRGATLDVVDGMGHDLPEPLLPRFADRIAALAGRA